MGTLYLASGATGLRGTGLDWVGNGWFVGV